MPIEKIVLDADAPQGSVNIPRLTGAINDSGLKQKFISLTSKNDKIEFTFRQELTSREQRVLMDLVDWSYETAQPAAPGVIHVCSDNPQITTSVAWTSAYKTKVPVIRSVAYLIYWTYEIGSYGWREAKSRVTVDGEVKGESLGSSGLFFNLNAYSPAAGSTLYVPIESKELEISVEYAAAYLNLSARIRRIHITVQQVKVN